MEKKGRAIPEGYHTVTPNLIIRGAQEALEFYKRTFDAEVTSLLKRPDGKVMHAEIRIGDSTLMIADECPPHEGHETDCVRSPSDVGGTTVNLYLYVKDPDAALNKAVNNGATVSMAVEDMFWGDRVGMFKDPFGHFWSVATHTRDVSPEEMKREAEKFYSQK